MSSSEPEYNYLYNSKQILMNYSEDSIVLLLQSLLTAWQIASEIQEFFFCH